MNWTSAFGTTTSTSDVTVTGDVVIDSNVTCGRVVIAEAASLTFDPDASAELSLWANMEVYGRLNMHPSSVAHTHTITFEGVDVDAFVGGGNAIIDTDIGMWVREDGYLTIDGPYRKAWTRLAGSETAGSTVLELSSTPAGWQVGDQIVVCPTEAPTVAFFFRHFDETTITAISGTTVTVSPALTYNHPAVSVGDGVTMTAEVLNLTRNVIIRGRPGAEAHMLFHVHHNANNSLKQLRLDAMGVRRSDSSTILGRYPIHFHHGFEGTIGTILDSVVTTRSKARGFVIHFCDGVTLRGCVAYDSVETPFWWDDADETNSVLYDRCVAAKVSVYPEHQGFRLAGFDLRGGSGNIARGCVAVGIEGNQNASGYQWPEDIGANRVWGFEDNVAHNNNVNGIFTWQNDSVHHVVDRFVAYHCGKAGIEHGAYTNNFVYRNCSLFGNPWGIALHSVASNDQPQFVRVHVRGPGIVTHAVFIDRHALPPKPPYMKTLFDGCVFEDFTVAGFGPGNSINGGAKEWFDVRHCTITATGAAQQFLLGTVDAESLFQVDNGGQAFEIRRFDQTGTLNTAWNARVTNVASFAGDPPAAFEPLVFLTLGDTPEGAPPDPDPPPPLTKRVVCLVRG